MNNCKPFVVAVVIDLISTKNILLIMYKVGSKSSEELVAFILSKTV